MDGETASVESRRRSSEHWFVLVGAGVVVLGLIGFAVFLQPDERGYGTHEKLGLKPCMPMKLWNVPCPGCGVTTSVTHAVQGDLFSSLRTQPFGLLLALGTVVFIGWTVVGHLRGKDLWVEIQRPDYKTWTIRLALVLAVAWVYKLGAVRGWPWS